MRRSAAAAALLAACAAAGGCEAASPEVVVVNLAGEGVLLKEVSFNGCLWTGVLAHGEETSPGRCLPGEDRVRFKKLGGDGTTWFSYQTLSVKSAARMEFHRFEIPPGDMEQDFSTPGPYGH